MNTKIIIPTSKSKSKNPKKPNKNIEKQNEGREIHWER